MKKNKVTPFIGMNNVKFGMKREEIRSLIQDDYKTILRNQYAENTSDYYPDHFYFIEYNKNDEFEAIEFTKGSNVYMDDLNIINFTFSDIKYLFDKKSINIEEENEISVTYHDLGLSITKDFDSDSVETVLCFSKYYW